MSSFVDSLLDKITMYRWVLYYLIGLVVIAIAYSFLGILSFSPVDIIISTLYLLFVCWVANTVFAYAFEAPTNVESVYISALILALIITPAHTLFGFIFLGWAGTLAMASKYILAIGKKHIFNPAAIAVVLTAFGIVQSASWWVGTTAMAPFVVLGGILIVRKIHRFDLVFGFFLSALASVAFFAITKNEDIFSSLSQVMLHSSLFFLAFVMLTEPLTTPPTKTLQIIYGALVGVLFSPQIHIGSVYSTPELALITGNIFAYLVSPKEKLVLRLKEKIQLAPAIFDFVFVPDKKMSYSPGQYMEWTLSHPHSDSRGNRRYFTLASSPTEDTLRLGVRFNEKGSSFKDALLKNDGKKTLIASQLSGDFTLPKNPKQKYVFIAGGIGITPYRSMIKYLLDKREGRDIVLLYSARQPQDFVYHDVFNQAQRELGIKVVYTITDTALVPQNWGGRSGPINEKMIREEVPDFKERVFYLSGPHAMVASFEEALKNMGLKERQIKKDYFPGF